MALTTLDTYRLLGNSGLKVSPFCLGCMTFGKSMMGMELGTDEAGAKEILDRYLEKGGNFLDTANTYNDGDSERFLGKFLQGKRDSVVVATKYSNALQMGDVNSGGNSRKSLFRSVEQSLKNLQTHYIDLLYIHYWDFTTPSEEVMRGFDDLVHSGKVHYVGVSDVPAWRIAELQTIAKFRGWPLLIAGQMQYSLVERNIEHDILPACRQLGIGVLPWSPLGSGILTGKYNQVKEGEKVDAAALRSMFVERGDKEKKLKIAQECIDIGKEIGRTAAQVALNWCLQKEGITSVIIGARTAKQLDDNLAALEFTLSKEHMERLDTISDPGKHFPHDFLTGPLIETLSAGGRKVIRRHE